jgi:hypothetical protein
MLAFLDHPGHDLHFEIINLITPTKLFLTYKVIHKFWGLGHGLVGYFMGDKNIGSSFFLSKQLKYLGRNKLSWTSIFTLIKNGCKNYRFHKVWQRLN